MKKIGVMLLAVVVFGSCKHDQKTQSQVVKEEHLATKKGDIKIVSYNYETLAPLLHKQDDWVYVINFWATWCKPCIEELPAFEQLHEAYKDKKVKVVLVSLDFPDHVESRLIPFIKKHNLQPEVILMDDPDQNTWIPKISEKWSGAIPATLIYSKDNREFYEQSFTYELLEKEMSLMKN